MTKTNITELIISVFKISIYIGIYKSNENQFNDISRV